METWPGGHGIVRCHDSRFGATELNPGLGHGRFHPFRDSRDAVVPTLYGASSLDGSLAESVFHGVPIRESKGRREIDRLDLRPMLVSTIAARRELKLIQLHGHGLMRLKVSRTELIESAARQYSRTVAWAAALHAAVKEADGMIWVSRKLDTSFSLVLFGDRVRRGDLEVIEPPVPLFLGAGFAEVQRVAELAGITILSE